MLAIVGLLSGCSLVLSTEGFRPVDAGPPDGASGLDGEVDPSVCLSGRCNALSHEGCRLDEGCYFDARGAGEESLVCLAEGRRALGERCELANDCARGANCVFGECVSTCCSQEGCAASRRCLPVIGNTPAGSSFVGVCLDNSACDVVAQDCARDDFGCVDFTDRGRWEQVCIPVGRGTPGQPCEFFTDCLPGTRCRGQGAGGGRCRRYCDMDSGGAPCPDVCEALPPPAPPSRGLCEEPLLP